MRAVTQVVLTGNIFQDERGWIINPLEISGLSRSAFYHFHVVSLAPGAVRGNHYHEEMQEWMCVCEGPAILSWRSTEGDVHNIAIQEEQPSVFIIPPNCEHAIRNNSHKTLHVICFGDTENNKTIRCSSLIASVG